eukprot:scaffold1724_cov341-Pavlova_lutheri.AAC.19
MVHLLLQLSNRVVHRETRHSPRRKGSTPTQRSKAEGRSQGGPRGVSSPVKRREATAKQPSVHEKLGQRRSCSPPGTRGSISLRHELPPRLDPSASLPPIASGGNPIVHWTPLGFDRNAPIGSNIPSLGTQHGPRQTGDPPNEGLPSSRDGNSDNDDKANALAVNL